MKVTELMIGDWVLVKELDPSNSTNVISEHQHKLQLKDFAEMYNAMCNAREYKRYEPIPLTFEILEKNGWVLKEWNGHKQFQYTFKECDTEITLKLDYTEPYFTITCFRQSFMIGHVHNLQHLLKECGIKNNIKI